jgi:hypothetical protein
MKLILPLIQVVNSQLMGGQIDPSGHHCVTDSGFQWCEETKTCVRSWETPCPSLLEGHVGTAGNLQLDYCPPCPDILFPCPEPNLIDIKIKQCSLITPQDSCGCQTGCPSYDCSYKGDLSTCLVEYNNSPKIPGSFIPSCNDDGNYNSLQCHGSIGSCWCSDNKGNEIENTRTMCRGECNLNEDICDSFQNTCETDKDCHNEQFCRITQSRFNQEPLLGGRRLQNGPISICVNKSNEGETCGGYTMPEYQTKCKDELECVNTRGPMIADAPGQCKVPCDTNRRDDYGNCINKIPDNCASWFDGCNTCQVTDGKADVCTLMYCFVQNIPKCNSFYNYKLNINDVCYRFCEDNTEVSIDKKDKCPRNTYCQSLFNRNSVSMIAYDSCGERAWTCQPSMH